MNQYFQSMIGQIIYIYFIHYLEYLKILIKHLKLFIIIKDKI